MWTKLDESEQARALLQNIKKRFLKSVDIQSFMKIDKSHKSFRIKILPKFWGLIT